ncbi:MAG: hypothetical protein RIQ89_2313 [Bacteroidota bacterium]
MGNVLITSAGRRVSLVRAFQAESRLKGGIKVWAADSAPHLSAACQTADDYFALPRLSEKTYIDQLLSACIDRQIKMVVPTIDTELQVLSINKDRFLEYGIYIIVSDLNLINICRDKRLTNKFFVDHGILVPKNLDKHDLTYPAFVKPYDGSSSIGIKVIHSPAYVDEQMLLDEKLMWMEYLARELHEEFTVDLYYNRLHQLCCAVPRRRIEIRAGEVSKGKIVKNDLLSLIKDKLTTIQGAVGCITAQFFRQKETGAIYGIEINPRFGGGYPFSYQAGANYPKWLFDEYFLEQQIDYNEQWEDKLLFLRYDAEVTVRTKDDR